MKIISLSQIVEINNSLSHTGYRISFTDSCGGQSLRIKPALLPEDREEVVGIITFSLEEKGYKTSIDDRGFIRLI